MSGGGKLRRRAEAAGILTRWTDYQGTTHSVAPETLGSLLDILGDFEDRQARPPTLVTATAGEMFRLPAGAEAGDSLWLTAEQGGPPMRLEGRAKSRGVVARAPLNPGYHHLAFGRRSITLAVAPRSEQAQDGGRREWGLSAQIYALYKPGDDGIAHYGALRDLARASAGFGAAALAISPLHAQFSADLSRFGPYAPSSRLWMNVLHIDPADAATALGLPPLRTDWRHDRAPLVDWPRASRRRLDRLRVLFDRVQQGLSEGTDPAARDFRAFRRAGGEPLLAHAVFEVLHARFYGQDPALWHWRQWPGAFRRYDAAIVRRVARDARVDVAFHLFLQWLAARQFRAAAAETGMRIGIIKDIAVGADSGGSEVWSRPGSMLAGASIGAPPDAFNTLGQAWGVTTFSPVGLAAEGYGCFIDLLRHSLRDAGGIRIDHILGLQRLWIVPDGADARHGAYLRYPLDDLLRLVALEAHRAGAVVLGEDLGTVPEGFRDRLAAHEIRGMQVLWFERDGKEFQQPRVWRRNAVAMTSTHDLPTVAGWWMGKDVRWRRQLSLFPSKAMASEAAADRRRDRSQLWRAFVRAGLAFGAVPAPNQAGKVLAAAIGFLGRTACDLAILPLEDALGRKEQPNLPGTIDQHPNWRRRILVPAGEICGRVRGRLKILSEARRTK